jgi:hypothetical protein
MGPVRRHASATPEKRPNDKQFEIESPSKPTCLTRKPLDSLEEPGSLELVQQSNVPCGAENLSKTVSHPVANCTSLSLLVAG